MSSVYGKNSKSIRKKDLVDSKFDPVAIDQIKFWHEAAAGETGINLGTLVMPTSVAATGNTNPSTSLLLEQNLFRYKNSLKIVSSLSGELTRGSFRISGNSRINFVGFTAQEGEYFECSITPAVQSGLKVIDAKVETARVTVAIGSTDAPLGFSTRTTKEEILVVRNGIVQTRNTNNSSTVEDGDYYVVDSGSGYGTIIRFNDPASGQDDDVFVTAIGNIIDPASDSTFAALQVLQGQLDAVIPTLAELAGVNETDFQSTPNDTDLKQFGQRVIALENNKQDKITNYTQAKTLPTDIVELNTTIGALTFNNLEVGKTYRVRIQAAISSPDSNNVRFIAIHDGNALCEVQHEGENTNDDNLIAGSQSPAFVATTDTVTFVSAGMVIGGSSDIISGNGTFSETWVELEELPNTELTTKWT